MLVYIGHTSIFPTLFCTTALGICQFPARIGTVFTSFVADLPQPYPTYALTISSFITFIISFWLDVEDRKTNQLKSA